LAIIFFFVAAFLVYSFFSVSTEKRFTPYAEAPEFFAALVFGAAGVYSLAGLQALNPSFLKIGWGGKIISDGEVKQVLNNVPNPILSKLKNNDVSRY
jgi:hypothetical protein